MKPRNEREREALRLSGAVDGLTPAQYNWIERKVVAGVLFTSGHRCWCSRCGGEWQGHLEGEEATCPQCGRRGAVRRGRNTTHKGEGYVQFVQTYRNWQVIRYGLAEWSCRKGEQQKIYYRNVFERWCQPGKPCVTLGVPLVYLADWCRIPYGHYGKMEVKRASWYYSEWMEVKTYPRKTLLPIYRRILGEGNIDTSQCTLSTLLGDIFSNAYLESLWKAGAWKEVREAVRYVDEFHKYWPSVKIALRHGFKPSHWGTYFEHLKALRFLRYDMHSPRYVAPPDFGELHDLVMRQYRNKLDALQYKRQEAYMLRMAMEREEAERRRAQEAKECAATFAERIARFEGLQIEDADIVIFPLMSIEAFKEEGNAMHHCVFSGSYWKRAESLILSARTREGDERVETIEVSLTEGRILQSQGIYNTPTERHEEILSLVNNAMPKILQMAV